MSNENPSEHNGSAPTPRDLASEAMRRRIAGRLFGDVEAPVTIGRFSVLDVLGSGGMGVVYAAADPLLDRVVALKVIRDGEEASPSERDRLLREARALAQLSHPNVVAVYEVGETEEGVFVAMERVRGLTLAQWLAACSRRSSALLDVFTQAARGLAAAHDAGIVHRDFKPSNTLVGDDGRVRIVDFGLARASSPSPRGDAEPDDDGTLASTEAVVTTSRAHAGTPGYMAPEQILGGPISARTDVFSFCVTLFEALHGQLPHAPLAKILADPRATVRATKRGRRVPRWLQRLLVRGLDFDAKRRFASMREVVAILEDAPRRRRVVNIAGIVAALAIGGGAILHRGWASVPCVESGVVAAWGPEVRRELHDALQATRLSFAAASERRLGDALDDYADRLGRARRNACEATRIRGERSVELMDRAMACLDRAEGTLTALVTLLRNEPVPGLVAATDAAVASLPSLEECLDRDALLADDTRSDDPRQAAAWERLQRAEFFRLASDAKRALVEVQGALEAFEQLGDIAGQGEALLVRGGIEARVLWDATAASRSLHAAYDAVLATHGDRRHERWFPRLFSELAYIGIHLDERPEIARMWLEHAHAAMRDDDPCVRGRLLAIEGEVLRIEGRAADAEARATEEIGLLATCLPLDHPERINAILRHAYARAEHDVDGAVAELQAGLAEAHERLGQRHPSAAFIELEIAQLHVERGDDERAHQLGSRAGEVLIGTYGPDHPVAVTLDLALARAEAGLGKLEAAIVRAARVLTVLDRAASHGPSERIAVLALLAELYRLSKREQDALAIHMRLLALEEELGVDLDHTGLLINVGEYLCRIDRCAEARPYFERLLARLADTEQPGLRAFPLHGLARIYTERGDPVSALPLLEQALALVDADPELPPEFTAEVARELAVCLRALGREPARVRALERRARDLERVAPVR